MKNVGLFMSRARTTSSFAVLVSFAGAKYIYVDVVDRWALAIENASLT